MRQLFNKYLPISVMILCICTFVIILIAIFDISKINYIIVELAHYHRLFYVFIYMLIIFFVYFYSDFIVKLFKRKKIDTFLSYSRSSKVEIDKIKEVLSMANNYNVYDFESIIIGQDIQSEIKKMIDNSELFVIIIDKNYIQSPYCSMELEAMINSGKHIIPILTSNECISMLPDEISKLKFVIISDDGSWKKAFEHSLYKQYIANKSNNSDEKAIQDSKEQK